VAAGREAPDADLAGVEPQLPGARAGQADGALGVEQRGGEAVARPEAVLKYECGDAAGGEPVGDFLALVAQGEVAVAAAGADDDGATVALVFRREVDRQRGGVLVRGAEGAGGAFGPEEDLFGLGGVGGVEGGEG
jgi:hypothetical protein